MNEWTLGAGTALWLGILTSISPCPLASNIAAVSYISRRVEHTRLVLLSGILYALGRTLTYLVLGAVLSASLLSIPDASHFLQKYMNRLLGPLLIFVGICLLELLVFPTGTGYLWTLKLKDGADRMGLWGAGVIGMVFALSFCPTSAALFFGSLLPLSIKSGSWIAFPTIYGIGTSLPVVGFGLLIAAGAQGLGRAFQRVSAFDHWAQRITGGVFVVIGCYMTVRYVLIG